MTFYHPADGYLYGWRWSNGDEAWWSTEDLALRYTHDIAGQPGEPIRRRYVVGEVEAWPRDTCKICGYETDAGSLDQTRHIEMHERERSKSTPHPAGLLKEDE